MATYKVSFDRIGRQHDIEPMIFADVGDPDELAELIFDKARPHLMSRDIEVVLNLVGWTGHIYAGMHNAGQFVIEIIKPDASASEGSDHVQR